MTESIRKGVTTVAALAALALGGAALANAASNGDDDGSGSTSSQQQQTPPGGPPPGPHVGANGGQERPLSGDVAAKVKAAAEKKLPGGTVERVETDADHGSPYEAHVRKSDGTEVEVLVNKDFEVTAVNAMGGPGGPGGSPPQPGRTPGAAAPGAPAPLYQQ
ncbi:MAG TPA: hypothetical protein VJT75_08350 [Thermoleophilaceae bacterium]|nr:hypothetical protein [Thermoleophilaceae bacterium]